MRACAERAQEDEKPQATEKPKDHPDTGKKRSRKPRTSRPTKKTESKKKVKQEEKRLEALAPVWTPAPYDFLYTDTWLYRLQNGKRVSFTSVSDNKNSSVESSGEVNTNARSPESEHTQARQGQDAQTPTPTCKTEQDEHASQAQVPGDASPKGGQQSRKPVRRNRKRTKQNAVTTCPTTSSGGLGVVVRRESQLFIPAFLSRGLWLRHRYTLADISLTLQCFKPYHLWHLAISERLSLTKLAVQASCATKDAFVYGAKAIVIAHLESWLAETFPVDPSQTSVLTNTESSHVPPLPVSTISADEFKSYLKMLPKRSTRGPASTDNGDTGSPECYLVSAPVTWRGIQILPIELERSRHLLMARVVPADEYTLIFGEPECLTMQPLHVTLSNGSRWAVCDEAFHFVL